MKNILKAVSTLTSYMLIETSYILLEMDSIPFHFERTSGFQMHIHKKKKKKTNKQTGFQKHMLGSSKVLYRRKEQVKLNGPRTICFP